MPLSCKKSGFPAIRHNELCDFTANLLTKVCQNVCIEPHLQPLSGEVLMNLIQIQLIGKTRHFG